MERESMAFDVVIVGAGPSGLSAACRLMQLSQEQDKELSVCVVEKGSEVGAHIISGAVFEPTALNELFPNWKELGAPLHTPVSSDDIYVLRSEEKSIKVPNLFVPKTMHNEGNYIISLGNLTRWLAEQAESLGVEIFPGFAAQEVLFNDDGSVRGIATGDMGISASGDEKDSFMPGMELHAKYTLFSEGCRGHLGKQLISHFKLDEGRDPQHYGIGIKELWDIAPEKHQQGLVVHTAGWPLAESGSTGGGFLYHLENNQVVLGLITDLGYSNPHLSPFEEFQRFKKSPVIKQYLEGGKRVSYGARALAKGGPQSLPEMTFPGGLLIGCDAGTMNGAKIKGSHTAMKSGMIAAEEVFKSVSAGSEGGNKLESFDEAFKASWLYKELHQQRNFGPAMHKFGNIFGAAFAFADLNIFNGKLPFTLHDTTADYAQLKPAAESSPINYPKPDGVITFDRLSSVFLSNTNHEEDQPCHLKLKDATIPLKQNLPAYNEPAQRYCPAGVYEIVVDENSGENRFQINSQNCVHCKTCDIKDPAQNITWVAPEGAGGPNYPNM
ncbi:electron transfer flavoprotein-ubiquinone oxidoreductase [Endozoicomonas sp. GU-1]|uniref:electron transfer flavoprotein-ubiquinone oxidoreductase n=1 Tax=Endozoicomonas sp. GU-1 TaxID=3009078 RepID=UPI0022B3DCFF|nr:electron transfer flavoprotein-ubiquinone oxidoreductase [Endozoicomonas sp. GU-1]WBA79455.1 electron transfer flavoprotein-ubiquinone oxidoreductase [Endozoicomonas sp. GU-1]WBA87097.1 electron transfer flavoprotein-ubiquinone oxidoreductase [Endozoicomonas sp. GU-1]